MVIKPKVKGSLALNCHPIGCKKEVLNQIEYVKGAKKYSGAKKVLIIGASSGYGLATRISLAFGGPEADTIGVSFEKEGNSRKVGTAGWYSNIWFKQEAEKKGLVAKNFIGDAFSHEMKKDVIKYIEEEFGGKIDLLVYSLASGMRKDPDTGEIYKSNLRPQGESLTGYTFNVEKECMEEITLEPATEEDLQNTVKVMGGEDWQLWVDSLIEADVVSEGFKTLAYSYIGPSVMEGIYRDGTIGAAKGHLEKTSRELDELLKEKKSGEAYVAVNKAIVTKASAYIPIFPLYASALIKVMEEKGIEENAIEHTHRLFSDMVYGDSPEFDSERRMRPDSWELRKDVQEEVLEIYGKVTEDNFKDLTDFEKYKKEFLKLNGFEVDGIDYEEDVDLEELAKLNP